jgi:hypothetical protein
VPAYRYAFNDYLIFDTNYATLMAAIYITYYFLLEPIAAVSCLHTILDARPDTV